MTTPIAAPQEKRSTHHIVLRQTNCEDIGLIMCDPRGNANESAWRRSPINGNSLKIYSGPQKYADMESPWTPNAQSDWSGGRGALEYEKDSTAYHDGNMVDTFRPGEIIMGGMPGFGDGLIRDWSTWNRAAYREIIQLFPIYTHPEVRTWAMRIEMSDTDAAGAALYLMVRKVGTVGNMEIASLNVADVNTASFTAQATLTASEFSDREWRTVRIPGLHMGAQWLTFRCTSATEDGHWEIMGDSENTTTMFLSQYGAVGTWIEDEKLSPTPIAYWAYESLERFLFAEYKGALFAFSHKADGTGPKVFINGDQGAATGGAASTITDTAKTWTLDQWAGAIVKIIDGAGSNQLQNWRKITTNDLDTLTVDPPWTIQPAANSVYVIVNTPLFTEITGHGLTSGITDVLAINGALYVCQGDGVNVRRMTRYNNSGTWTTTWADEGYACQWMTAGADQSGLCLWRANQYYPARIWRAAAVDCTSGSGAALTWGTPIPIGDLQERITGLQIYGEYGNLWVLKEHSIWQVIDSIPSNISIPEMNNTNDDRNGRAHLTYGLYLFFSWHDGLERYYNQTLDGVGPDKSEAGLPADRRGHVSALAGYPGRIYAAIDAGNDGYSSVLCWNMNGWQEVYRAPGVGQRISGLVIQSIPGNAPDLLWFSLDGIMVYIPIALDPMRAGADGYIFNPYGSLITSWMHVSLHAVSKYWNALKVVLGEYEAYSGYAQVDYQTDANKTWMPLAGDPEFSSYDPPDAQFKNSAGVEAKRLRLRIRITALRPTVSPQVIATVVEAGPRIENRYAIGITARLIDHDHDLLGNPDYVGVDAKLEQLAAWAESATPVDMYSIIPLLHEKSGFIDALNIGPLYRDQEDGLTGHIVNFQLIERWRSPINTR